MLMEVLLGGKVLKVYYFLYKIANKYNLAGREHVASSTTKIHFVGE